ncbi:hypothetical protein [Streptomyces sp. NPDC059874]|uniref:hypothetical protein n=1 Tax=Streptomyces sp. NPDC059874 TaxID=3346983 RepID=UPI0036567994
MDIYAGGAAAANDIRAGWALAGLFAYAKETGQDTEPGWQEDPTAIVTEVAGDLIASVFHVARRLDIDPDSLVSSAYLHFTEEVAEEAQEAAMEELEPCAHEASAMPTGALHRVRWAFSRVRRVFSRSA